MTEPVGNTKVFVQLMPSLLHMSLVKIATRLYRQFDTNSLYKAFESKGISETFADIECYPKLLRYNNTKKIEPIPPRLRRKLMETIYGLKSQERDWKIRNIHPIKLKDEECTFYFKSNGMIDAVKTAQQVAQIASIDIRKRFELVCSYCLVDSIQVVWAEAEASGKTGSLESVGSPLVVYWVRWMRNGSLVPWKEAALQFYSDPSYYLEDPRYCVLFQSLLPEERKDLMETFLENARISDLKTFVYTLTPDEEKQLLNDKRCFHFLLNYYLQWPLQTVFIETVKNAWDYIDHHHFLLLLNCIFWHRLHGNFDYWELFEDLYESSPHHLRKKIIESSDTKEDFVYFSFTIKLELLGRREKGKNKSNC